METKRFRVLALVGFAIALALVGLGQVAHAALIGSPILVKDVCWWPDVCYNAYSDQYLVFWRDYNVIPQVHARRVDANTGALLGSDFAVSNWSDAYRTGVGDAVYNSVNHEWFVVYTHCVLDQQEDVYGQRIDSAGNQVGSAIPITTEGGYESQSTVAYDSTSNRYLVTWTDWTDVRKIRGRLFDQYGSPVGSVIQISDSSIYKKSNSNCVYNPISNEFLVVWADDRNWNGEGNNNDWGDVYAQRINASTGALVGGNYMVCGPEGTPYVPDGMDSATVVCNTQNGRYFLAITRLLPVGDWVAKGRVLSPDGSAYTGLFDASYPDGGVSVGAVYNPVEDSFVMSCLDAVPDVHDINVRRFTATGAALGSPYKVFNSNYECNFGGLAIRPSDGKMMQVTQWFEDKITGIRINTVMAQRFDVSGIPVAPVANFVVRSPNQQNNLAWTNPVESAFTGTMIRCRTDTYPTSPTDGALVVDKSGSPSANETYAHSGLTNNVAYYYSAWAHDGGPSYSVPRYAWGIPTPSLCFLDTFPYPDGALNGNGGWSGTATNQIEVSGQTVKINGDTTTYSSATTTSCSGGASGIIWMRVSIRQGAGSDKNIWSLRINDISGANLARWYGTGSTARPRMGDSGSVLAPQNLTGTGVWDVLEVKIYTATDSSEFFFNGTSIGTLSHLGAGNTAGELKFETMGNTDASGHCVYLDDLTVGEYDATLPDPVTSFTATGGDAQVSLSWTNPTDPEYAGTKILCKTTGYPTSATDGIVVYYGPGTIQVHTGLTNGVRYYYSAFTHNAILNYSTKTDATAIPVDVTPPAAGISAPSIPITKTGPVSYTVNFSELVYGFDSSSDVQLNPTGGATAGTVAVTGSGSGPYTVTLSNISGSGTLGITVKASSCLDAAGNANTASAASATFIVVGADGRISNVRNDADGSPAVLGGKALYLSQAGFGYIEELDRTSGIRVEGALAGGVGDLVVLSGVMGTKTGGERYVLVGAMAACGTGSVDSLGLNNRALIDAMVCGLYVKAWGKVKPGSITGNSYLLTDGSDEAGIKVITMGAPGVIENEFVTVVGATGLDAVRVIYGE